MTREELQALKAHDRIKYIGKRPLSEVCIDRYSSYARTLPAGVSTKGAIVSYTVIDPYIDGTGGTPQKQLIGEVDIWFWGGGCATSAVPEEWELVEKRGWVEGQTKYKRATSQIPKYLENFKSDLAEKVRLCQDKIKYKLEELPVDRKLKLIMDLTPEQKRWFEVAHMEPKEILDLLEKATDTE